jgi:hypothetical protein
MQGDWFFGAYRKVSDTCNKHCGMLAGYEVHAQCVDAICRPLKTLQNVLLAHINSISAPYMRPARLPSSLGIQPPCFSQEKVSIPVPPAFRVRCLELTSLTFYTVVI